MHNSDIWDLLSFSMPIMDIIIVPLINFELTYTCTSNFKYLIVDIYLTMF